MAKQFKPETLCVQAGWTPKKGEPRVLPIYQSTTFKYDTSEQMARLFDLEDSGYFYTRLQNPTNDAVAAKIAALEGGVAAMLTSSGQAANFYAIFNICQAGDHFVCSSTIYGGTFNLFGVTLKKLGIDVTFVNPDASEEEISAAFRPNTKALFGETISNPTLEVLDIEKFARIAHSHGVSAGCNFGNNTAIQFMLLNLRGNNRGYNFSSVLNNRCCGFVTRGLYCKYLHKNNPFVLSKILCHQYCVFGRFRIIILSLPHLNKACV